MLIGINYYIVIIFTNSYTGSHHIMLITIPSNNIQPWHQEITIAYMMLIMRASIQKIKWW
jgi:hypothetical protein